jgi:hypothetical protein
MAHLVANIPPVHCYIRKEFLYDFEKAMVNMNLVSGYQSKAFVDKHLE